jgi:multidrug efflux pump subunit AcrA (membrane-fusion protein)
MFLVYSVPSFDLPAFLSYKSPIMNSVLSPFKRFGNVISTRTSRTWKWYRGRAKWQQAGIVAVLLALVVGGVVWARSGSAVTETAQIRTVTLASVGSLSGNSTGASIVGSVRSVTEADLLAQVGGTVRSVHTSLGAHVPAGFVIADLDNATQAASVLQAEGVYDSAIAARNSQSLPDTRNSARDAYNAAYTNMDTTLHIDIDQFFGEPTPIGPQLLIDPGPVQDLSRKRVALGFRIDAWQQKLSSASSADPAELLDQATADTQAVSSFLLELSAAANTHGSRATDTQLAALATARANVDATLARLASARAGLRTGSVSATASADASVKTALGSLRAAQANYEKTRIRATIGGTINFLPIKTGQYVSAFEHVATVAQNGALEIVAYVPEEQRTSLTVGMTVSVEGNHKGTVTAVAPALDPTTKQIEIHIAVDAAPDLVNGQSVRITLPSEVVAAPQKTASSTSADARVLLPLTAVKLLPESRAVFTVDKDGRLVAHTVTIGDVIGDRIEVISGVTADMRIVTDVRGLSEGQKVQIGDAPSIQTA